MKDINLKIATTEDFIKVCEEVTKTSFERLVKGIPKWK